MTHTTPQLWTDAERDRMLGMLAEADSVELKMSVPDADRRSALVALNVDPLEAEMLQVWFFDTPDLALNESGVIARARRTKSRDDATVKLRPVIPDELPAKLRARSGFGVEIDAMPTGFVCSGRLKEKLKRGTVRQAMLRGKSPGTLFSKQQLSFFEQHAPAGLALDDLKPLGPITVLKLKFVPAGLDRSLVAELWTYPDGQRILELSTKCAPTDAFAVAAETREFLEERGINMTGEQQTKTKTALEFFAQELRDPEETRDRRSPRRRAQLLDRRHGGEAPPAGGRPGAGEAVPDPGRRGAHPGAQRAEFSIEHERDSDSEEIEFQFTWTLGAVRRRRRDDEESLPEV